MLDSLVNRALTVVAIAAAVSALGFYVDGRVKAARIETLQGELKSSRASEAAAEVLAVRRPQSEARYGDILAAINAASERTSNACLTDPRVRAYYDGLSVRDAERRAAEERAAD